VRPHYRLRAERGRTAGALRGGDHEFLCKAVAMRSGHHPNNAAGRMPAPRLKGHRRRQCAPMRAPYAVFVGVLAAVGVATTRVFVGVGNSFAAGMHTRLAFITWIFWIVIVGGGLSWKST